VLATQKSAAASIITLLLLASAAWANPANANPGSPALLTMPKEQINYTITRVNGTWWAKIDGTYPLHILTEADGAPSCVPAELPMVYPTPPNTTNIHMKVDGVELEWSNWPQGTHHTAIGDWSMVYCLITPVSERFTLTIHYEHPVERVNESYIFLYDLNISPYLSPWSLNSTAFFIIRMDANASNLQAYTTETDMVWNPINYTVTQDGEMQVVSIQMYSEYSKMVQGDLAGDLAITFSDAEIPEFPTWVMPALLLVVVLLVALGYRKFGRSAEKLKTFVACRK
jgi:hypothetical protein